MRKLLVSGLAAACIVFVGGCAVGVDRKKSADGASSTSAPTPGTGTSSGAGGATPGAGATASTPGGRARSGGPFCENFDAVPSPAALQAIIARGDQEEMRHTFRDLWSQPIRDLWNTKPNDIGPEVNEYYAGYVELQEKLEAARYIVSRLDPVDIARASDPKFVDTWDQVARYVDKHCGPKPT